MTRTIEPSGAERRLAVLGSPIAHSLSPRLHTAAYVALGLPWDYQAFDVTGDRLPEFLDSCDESWRGLSLTMPLKRDVIPLLDTLDRVATLTGVANTLLFDGQARRGFNTDVAGMTRAFHSSQVDRLDDVVILGGGATAASALVAAAGLGAGSARFLLRTPAKATALQQLGTELGVAVQLSSFSDWAGGIGHPDAVISTIPNGSAVDLTFAEQVRRASVLFDVAYDPWPTALAQAWTEVSGRVISGIEMLLGQALVQVRIFVSGDPETELPQEGRVLDAMRTSIGPALQA
ncbi:MAG TPA: shikimate dehydrogenase [Homoserinimonas sp.]|nr:shikimate dehydrogenase [Homoserinimonas sp.]